MADFNSNIGNHPEWTVANPHPEHGVNPNIINEFGHTKYPMFVHKFDDKGGILFEKVLIENDKGKMMLQHPSMSQQSRVVNNEDEESAANDEGYYATHIEHRAAKKFADKPKVDASKQPGWDGKK